MNKTYLMVIPVIQDLMILVCNCIYNILFLKKFTQFFIYFTQYSIITRLFVFWLPTRKIIIDVPLSFSLFAKNYTFISISIYYLKCRQIFFFCCFYSKLTTKIRAFARTVIHIMFLTY